uniref:ATP-sensitive inward rectifier potassium channel 1-like n=1 Tax=Phallusia mammillata TaxID=59560 RepID=A0A6F9DEW4_9ASCI|nr:ATP-sensitive inward rectifier potassium channel 1-like [Phallusia mammillata]
MAYLDRLESESSYLNLASVGDSDDSCSYANGIDKNNNDEANRSPHITFKPPGFYRSVSTSAAYCLRRDNRSLEDYARNGIFFHQQRRRLRMSQTEMKALSGRAVDLSTIADSRNDVFLPSSDVYLERKSDSSDANDNTDASSYAGSQCGEPSSPCDSSNDETDGEDSNDSTQMIRSLRESTTSVYNTSFNNNNKKKPRLSQSGTPRSVNFRIQSPQRRVRKNYRVSNSSLNDCRRPHHHSLQISSVRAASTCDCSNCLVEYNQRLIDTDGSSNIQIKDVNGKIDMYSRYFNDIFTTFLDSSWSWILFITLVVYLGHWIIFGALYWIFAIANNDYAKMYGSEAINASANATTGDPCVYQVYDFVSAFLFSMESETTIGYGLRSITPECPVAVACLTIQCIISGIFDTWIIGLCYARMARPDSRSKTVLFASKAVICKRDGKRCLLVRVANLRKSLLVGVTVRAKMLACRAAETREKKTGIDLMLEHHNVHFKNSTSAFLTAPVEYCHVIDKSSPLYGIRADRFNRASHNYFEIVFILTGTLESTGLTMQAQTSYLSKEIFYGHRYAPVVTKRLDKGRYDVNFKRFHEVMAEPLSVHQSSRTKDHKRAMEERRGTVTTLVEETEDDVLSTSDEVFTTGGSHERVAASNSWV